MSTVKENLIAARALIDDPAKWRKDARYDEDSCCAILAANRVAGKAEAEAFLWGALYNALPPRWQTALHSFHQGLCVGEFNDDPETTHADVLALFDRAIAAQDGAE